MTSLDRREFLALAGSATVGLVGTTLLARTASAMSFGMRGTPASRTLIVVDLQGGNDALNTLVPSVGRYYDARPAVGLPQNELLTFDGLELGVHPALSPLRSLWDSGQMTAIYGTGIDGQQRDRSHFNAQDAWRTARANTSTQSGWLGRYLEATQRSDPSPLRAVALGQRTIAAEGETGRPVSIQSVKEFRLRPPQRDSAVVAAFREMGRGSEGALFGDVKAAIPEAIDAVERLGAQLARVAGADGLDPDAEQNVLAVAQALIVGDARPEVIYVTIDGWDTHAVQAARHTELLDLLATGIGDLYAGLAAAGRAETTTTLVVSEFGRRVAENGSLGTDHGKGGLSLLFGPSVRESALVRSPDLENLNDGDLRIVVDARHLYGDVLRWLGATEAVVAQVLDDEWSGLDLLKK